MLWKEMTLLHKSGSLLGAALRNPDKSSAQVCEKSPGIMLKRALSYAKATYYGAGRCAARTRAARR